MDYSRQSFLGPDSQEVFKNTTVGLIGYSGGGSHLGEQLSRIGIGNFVVVDNKVIEEKHLPRFAGGNRKDVNSALTKVDVAERQIRLGNPVANVKPLYNTWQESVDDLLNCDIIFGTVDSFRERDNIEHFCRRNLVPYIDIGMDVYKIKNEYLISGQIIQSIPGGNCMRCCNFITDDKLKDEANKYGQAGPAAQVIWTNGILASTAVGWAINLLCPWYKEKQKFRWLCLDGNTGQLSAPAMLNEVLKIPCNHYMNNDLGDPLCDIREFKIV